MGGPLIALVERRVAGTEPTISAEPHVIGEDIPNWVIPNEAPLDDGSISIPGFTRVTGPPATGQYRVAFKIDGDTGGPERLGGAIEFNSADDGTTIAVTYKGRGSQAFASTWNRFRNRLQGETILTSAATIVVPVEALGANGHRQFYAPLAHAAEFQLPTDVPVGVTFDLLVANNITGNGGPFTPTFAAADFDFGDAGAPTLPTTADRFHWLGFGVRNDVARFFGIQTGFTI